MTAARSYRPNECAMGGAIHRRFRGAALAWPSAAHREDACKNA
jgi:hypothetical protein